MMLMYHFSYGLIMTCTSKTAVAANAMRNYVCMTCECATVFACIMYGLHKLNKFD